MVEHGIFERPMIRICLDRSLAKPSSIQLFFAPSSGHLAHGYPLGGLPRVLAGRSSSVVRPYASGRPGSPASHVLERTSSKGSTLESASFRRLSRQSSRLDGGGHPRPNNSHAFTFAHWSSGRGSASTHSSTRCPNSDRADPRRLSTPNNHAEVVQEDFALFPRGLAVQRSSRVFDGENVSDGENVFDREHSVLLPPPITLFERPLTHDSRINPHYRGYTKTATLFPSDTIYFSPNSLGTTASPIETDRDESTWTSFSYDEENSSPGSGESKVCMHLSSSKA